jgi:hypothetical protein
MTAHCTMAPKAEHNSGMRLADIEARLRERLGAPSLRPGSDGAWLARG